MCGCGGTKRAKRAGLRSANSSKKNEYVSIPSKNGDKTIWFFTTKPDAVTNSILRQYYLSRKTKLEYKSKDSLFEVWAVDLDFIKNQVDENGNLVFLTNDAYQIYKENGVAPKLGFDTKKKTTRKKNVVRKEEQLDI